MIRRAVDGFVIVTLAGAGLLTMTAESNGQERGSGVAERNLKDGENRRTVTNSIGMTLVEIPAGEFLMGNADSAEKLARSFPAIEQRRIDELVDELPVHRVRITRPFFMSAHEVTVEQFRRFVDGSGQLSEAERDGTGGWGYNRTKNDFEGRKPEYSWRNPGFKQADDHPVVNVTWNDAVAFCEWLGKKEGHQYRLPTEAEWEYACRAGAKTTYSTGDDTKQLAQAANMYDERTASVFPQWKEHTARGSDGFEFTAPVGSLQPNTFGLYDMHGNVWEWCSDWYGEDYYAKSPVDDPQGPRTGKVRVRRGGSWQTWAFYCRASFRNWNTPETRYPLVGFRVVRERMLQ
jgi:formylglycine-generating enzyme required for sulfatase activity